jgi:hypothetical protein
MLFLGKRETVNAWKKAILTDSERKMNRSEVSSKWNECRQDDNSDNDSFGFFCQKIVSFAA